MTEKHNGLTRRGFISTAVTGLVSAGIVGVSPSVSRSRQEEEKKKDEGIEVITRKLGRTDIVLPIVSMGVMNADNPELLKASYELGIRHFDSAAYYQRGKNEEMVGKVVKEMGIRKDVVIATKIYTSNFRDETKPGEVVGKMTELLDISLKRLQMDYVDILYVHSVKEPETARNEEIAEAMSKFKKEGRARYIGVTTHTKLHEIIDAAVEMEIYDVILTVVNFTLADYAELYDSIERATKKGVGIIAMKTQAGSQQRRKIDFSDEYSSTAIATASLKWVLRNEHITTAIPGYTTFEHMKEDFSVAANLAYTKEEKSLLEDQNVKVGMGFCRQCTACVGSCPNGADIPALMRTHMYAARYSNLRHARATLDEIAAGSGLDACRLCASCSAACAHSVDIAENIDELRTLYM